MLLTIFSPRIQKPRPTLSPSNYHYQIITMKTFTFLAVSLLVAAASADNSVPAFARNLASKDKTAECCGEINTFSSASGDSNDVKSCIVQHPQATSGNKHKCTMSCTTTSGKTSLTGVVTSADTINNANEGTKDENASGGCTPGLEITVTADRNDNLLVEAHCENGCENGSMTCNEVCETGFVESAIAKMSGLFGGTRRALRGDAN